MYAHICVNVCASLHLGTSMCTPSQSKTEMCARGEAKYQVLGPKVMWGSSQTVTPSRWHYEWAPHLPQFLDPPPSLRTQWVDNQATYPRMEDCLHKT